MLFWCPVTADSNLENSCSSQTKQEFKMKFNISQFNMSNIMSLIEQQISSSVSYLCEIIVNLFLSLPSPRRVPSPVRKGLRSVPEFRLTRSTTVTCEFSFMPNPFRLLEIRSHQLEQTSRTCRSGRSSLAWRSVPDR